MHAHTKQTCTLPQVYCHDLCGRPTVAAHVPAPRCVLRLICTYPRIRFRASSLSSAAASCCTAPLADGCTCCACCAGCAAACPALASACAAACAAALAALSSLRASACSRRFASRACCSANSRSCSAANELRRGGGGAGAGLPMGVLPSQRCEARLGAGAANRPAGRPLACRSGRAVGTGAQAEGAGAAGRCGLAAAGLCTCAATRGATWQTGQTGWGCRRSHSFTASAGRFVTLDCIGTVVVQRQ